MKSFHILERELRVRSRQRATFWSRVAIAAVAMLMALSWFQATSGPGSPAQTGRAVFGVLAWLLFGFCLLEGARQTSDAICLEQREGTLGLLFLTDLSGLDVTLGKLAAATAHAFCGLLAAFPVLGITLAAGGITAGEFWRTQLALLVSLLLASTTGLWVSARSRDEMRALLGALGLILGMTVVPLLWDAASRSLMLPSFSPAAGLWFAGDAGYRASPSRFWATQGLLLLGAGLFLVGAGRKTSCVWREAAALPAPRPPPRLGSAEEGWDYRVTPRLHSKPAPASLEVDPVGWLARRQVGTAGLIWLAVALPFLSMLLLQLFYRFLTPGMVAAGAGGLLSAVHVGLEACNVGLLAFAAARLLAAAKQSGVLELLLGTPVSDRAIVQAHWQVFWRRLRLPLLLYMLVPAALYLAFWVAQGQAGRVLPWSYLLLGRVPQIGEESVRMIAAGWLGLWFGVHAPSLGQAVGRTLLIVLLIPWMGSTVISILVRQWLGQSSYPLAWWFWLAWLSASLLSVAWLLGSIRWARRRLLGGLREAVTSASLGPKFAAWRKRWWSTRSI